MKTGNTVRIGKQIDRGGCCEICEASMPGYSGQIVAKRMFSNASDSDRIRFRREVKIHKRLDHKNIVKIIGENLTDEPYYYIMDRARSNLAEAVASDVSKRMLMYYFREVLNGIEYAHMNNVLHRDLKPHNVLLFGSGEDCVVQISDFGLGKMTVPELSTLTNTKDQIGTVAYMAFEQFDDAKRVDERADIFSLGKILYNILTKSAPFPGIRLYEVEHKFRYIVEKACQEDPDDRFQSVKEFRETLDMVMTQNESFVPPKETLDAVIGRLKERVNRMDVDRFSFIVSQLADESEVLQRILPSIPIHVWDQIHRRYSGAFTSIITIYDNVISGRLDFDYCDTVGAFYKRLFHAIEDDEIRILILRRIGECGYSHRRYFLGALFGELLQLVRSHRIGMAMDSFIRENKPRAKWFREYISIQPLPPILQSAFKAST